ncbi:hypothetical protein RCH06_002095 [Polaromonas sp. CG_9.5]|uniref:hypothetical protein n=1 Tax=Polaromonas sp. CG_9.5 TaxID=3071705 RepID=UPI002E006838|nr:hypothetical protein [Polaromonas sp. CG_9.5]
MLGVQALKAPAREAKKASLAWKPWRSYAIRAWSGWLDAGIVATRSILAPAASAVIPGLTRDPSMSD